MHFIIDAPGVLLPHIQQGTLRALAVTGPQRSADLPDVPTMVESGYPDFVITFWTGVVAPAGTPAAIVGRLNAAINEAVKPPEVVAALGKLGAEVRTGSAEAFAAFLARERDKWVDVVTRTGIRAE
jgi:tripartite-type tricarboxylate transporter receptor subunit TctC